jgi:hypothetical protein
MGWRFENSSPGRPKELVALFARVPPDFPTGRADHLDETEAFLRNPSSFALAAYVDDQLGGERAGHHPLVK